MIIFEVAFGSLNKRRMGLALLLLGCSPSGQSGVQRDPPRSLMLFRLDPRDSALVPVLGIELRDALGNRRLRMGKPSEYEFGTSTVPVADTGRLDILVSFEGNPPTNGTSTLSLTMKPARIWEVDVLRNNPSFWGCMQCCEGLKAFPLPQRLRREAQADWPSADTLIVWWDSRPAGTPGKLCL